MNKDENWNLNIRECHSSSPSASKMLKNDAQIRSEQNSKGILLHDVNFKRMMLLILSVRLRKEEKSNLNIEFIELDAIYIFPSQLTSVVVS